jgi:hypothetical protein
MLLTAVAALGLFAASASPAQAQVYYQPYYYYPNTGYLYGYPGVYGAYPGTSYSYYYSNPYLYGFYPGYNTRYYTWDWYNSYTNQYRTWRWFRRF